MSQWNLELARIAKQATFDVVGFVFLYLVVVLATWRRNEKYTLLGVGVLLVLLLCYAGAGMPGLLASPLLSRAAKFRSESAETSCHLKKKVLVVLGGGNFGDELLTAISQSRVIEAAKIAKQSTTEDRKLTIVLSGGTTKIGSRVSEAQVMKRQLLLELGVQGAQHQFFLESESMNTNDNAANVKKLLQEKKQKLDIILVTSELHMPRAQATFVKKGFSVCPWPSASFELQTEGLASFYAGSLTVSVLNEYLGMLGYRMKGWL